MKVKMKVQEMLDAMVVVTDIIKERRPMPQRGKIAFAKMHKALVPLWMQHNTQRDELIKVYDYHPMIKRAATSADGEDAMQRGWVEIPHPEFGVPADKQAEFDEKWNAIGNSEIEFDVAPIPVKLFDMGANTDGSIHGHEIIVLGDLITE